MRIERLIADSAESAGDDSECLRVGQTVCQRAVGGRPRNGVFCFGEPDVSHLAQILSYYDEINTPPTFYLSPARFGPSVARALTASGFAQVAFDQAMLYGALPELDHARQGVSAQLVDDIDIAVVTPDRLDAFVQTTAEGFGWGADWREAAMADLRARVVDDNVIHLLAVYRGEPAGVADLRLHDGVASLGNGAVRPEFRRHGVHSALIAHRLALAKHAGAEVVVGGASYGSASFRNQQRAGLRLAYIESGWTRPS